MSAGCRYQPPSNWAGTGSPCPGDAAKVGAAEVDGVGSFAEGVDCPHDEARKNKATASAGTDGGRSRCLILTGAGARLHLAGQTAYSPANFERLAAESPFGTCTINTEGIGLEVRLEKPVA
jgi:hypothetical protein